MTVIEMIEQYRSAHNMSYRQFAAQCGISSGYMSMLINGRNPQTGKPPKISIEIYNKLAKGMGLSIDELFSVIDDAPVTIPPKTSIRSDFFPASAIRPLSELHHQRVPMIGSVAAGEPIMGEELGVYVEAPVRCDAAVTVSGDSMEPTYKDGDVLYIRQQPEVLNGQVAVVFVDDLAAIKHVYREHDGVMLVSDNPAYPPMRYRIGDNADAINIFGIPIGFTRMYRR